MHLIPNNSRSGRQSLNCRSSGRPPTLVALDIRGTGSTAGLDNIRVQRALHEEFDLLSVRACVLNYLSRGLLEHPNEFAPDDLPLLLWI